MNEIITKETNDNKNSEASAKKTPVKDITDFKTWLATVEPRSKEVLEDLIQCMASEKGTARSSLLPAPGKPGRFYLYTKASKVRLLLTSKSKNAFSKFLFEEFEKVLFAAD